jgi:hypothetical protein
MNKLNQILGAGVLVAVLHGSAGCETPAKRTNGEQEARQTARATGPQVEQAQAVEAPTPKPEAEPRQPAAATDEPAAAPRAATPPAAEPPAAEPEIDENLSPAQQLIAGARKLSFSSERTEVLLEIAGRPDLSTADQKALVDVACELTSSDQIASVFSRLAQNDALTKAGKAYLIEKLDCILFSSERQKVLQLLGDTTPRD